MTLTEKLQTLAKSSGLTQKELAFHLGVSESTIYRFFSSATDLKSSDLIKLMKLLGADLEAVIDEVLFQKSSGASVSLVSPKAIEVDLIKAFRLLSPLSKRSVITNVAVHAQYSKRQESRKMAKKLYKEVGRGV